MSGGGARSGVRAYAALIALGAPAAAAVAQPVASPTQPPPQPPRPADCPRAPEAAPRQIAVGQCLRSTLAQSDPRIDGYIPYEDYQLRLGEGEAVRIDMDALPPAGATADGGAFDTYLEVRRAGEETPLRANDDRPGSLDSTLIFAAPAPGAYVIRARALGAGTGDYLLRVAAAPAARVRTLELGGRAITSTIELDDLEANGRNYEEYRLRLSRGQVARIDMEAAEEQEIGAAFLDPYLTVYAPGSETVLEANDDRGDSLNARLIFAAPADGDYLVRAQGYSGSVGIYRIAATRLPAVPRPDMLAGDAAEDVWADGSPATERDGVSVRYHEYMFAGTEGERIQVDAASNLVPRLMVGTLERQWLADQSGDSEGAHLFAVLPETGNYIVRIEVPATANGNFELRLTRRGEAPSLAPAPLDPETPLEGRLGLDSGLILGEDGYGQVESFYRLYALPVAAGETVTVTLESSDFDPVLDAGTMSVLGYAVAASNDDSYGINSRLELHPTGTDTVHLRVRSLHGTIGEGRFTLRVNRGAVPPPAPGS